MAAVPNRRRRRVALPQKHLTAQSTLLAYLFDFCIMLVVAIAALPLVFLMRPPRRHNTRDQELEAAME